MQVYELWMGTELSRVSLHLGLMGVSRWEEAAHGARYQLWSSLPRCFDGGASGVDAGGIVQANSRAIQSAISGPVDLMHISSERGGSHVVDATKVSVSDLPEQEGQYLRYVYELDKQWKHKIVFR